MAVGGSRTLKLSILGDVDNLQKSLKAANADVENSSSRMGDFSKKAGLAFAAAGVAAAAYAGKLLIDGVKSAIEDEKAQAKLATTLKNVSGATNAQIAATEAYITKTSLAVGVTDDELRPSLERLARATKDVGEAQKLQTLALDIAAGSGKSLEAVSAALGKGFEGNSASLAKLGIGLTAAELKTMSFDEVTAALSKTFKGQANIQADTFAGKMERLNIAINEGKETVGSFVLDAITPMVTILVDNVIPRIGEFASSIGQNLAPVFRDFTKFFTETLVPIFKVWWELLSTIIIPGIVKTVTPILQGLFAAFQTIAKSIKDNEANLKPLFDLFVSVAKFIYNTLAPAVGTVLGGAFKALGVIIGGVITAIGNVVSAITKAISLVQSLIDKMKNIPIVGGIFGGASTSSAGLMPSNGVRANSTVINVNVSGAIDSEGTARTVINTLNDSFYRGTLGAGSLVGISA
jgi:hypothetical protein